jgi:hypothetical protein
MYLPTAFGQGQALSLREICLFQYNINIHYLLKERKIHMVYEPKRRTLRLPTFDYHSNGAYFVTICAYKREPHFQDSTLRHILEEQWKRLPRRFPTITLDSFVIMPDHVHFIIWLGTKEGHASPSLANVVGSLKSLIAVEWLRYLKAIESQQ